LSRKFPAGIEMIALSGFLTGLLVGITGVGGGALMTPLLLLLFGIAPATAVGTDLWFAAITKTFAGGIHHAKGLVDWSVVKRLWLGSLPVSAFTIALMQAHLISLDAHFITRFIAYVVLITAVGMFFQERLQAIGKHWRISNEASFRRVQAPLTVVAGGLLGFLVTFTSIGAGALGTVFLTYLYPLRLNPKRLVATDIVHAIPLAVFAGIGHLAIGHVDFVLLGNLLLGSIPGILLGSRLSSRMPAHWIRWALALVLIAVTSKMLWSA
jgi:uncharacterized membrane protein YfcA